MKVIFLSFSIAVLQSIVINAQSNIPSYLDVAKKFLTSYSFTPVATYDRLTFAKKKDGWVASVVDISKKDSIKKEDLFWSLNDQAYHQLYGFGQADSTKDLQSAIDEILQSDDPPFLYGFERCRYFGYNGWDADIIRDFGNTMPANDTLLEGLARAYAFYAERFLWHGLGGHPFDNDSLKSKLGKLEIPNKKRVEQFIFYTNKSAECYRILAARNPGYGMLVGNPKMKVLNEQFHQYQHLMILGDTNATKNIVDKIDPNDSIYQRMGYTYLNACPPNSILITFGDNDTYGPWYVQLKEGFRKDVTVLNQYLLGVPSHIKALKKEHPTLFTTNVESFGNINTDYFSFDDENKPGEMPLTLKNLLNDIQTTKYTYAGTVDTFAAYKNKNIRLDVDLNKLKKICSQNNLASSITLELKEYLILSDLLILDIVNTNLHSRPICFAVQSGLFPLKYLQQEGAVYRLLPLNEDPKAKAKVEILKMENYLKKNYAPVTVPYGEKPFYYEDGLRGLHAKLFSDLITNCISLPDNEKAKEWADRYLSYPVTKKIATNLSGIQMAEVLLKTGHTTEALQLVEKVAQKLFNTYANYSAIEFYNSKDNLLQILVYLKEILSTKSIQSETLEKTIALVSEKKE